MLAVSVVISPAVFKRLCRARKLLRDDEAGTRSVRAVAGAVGLSPFHFIRTFRALFGVTPHQFRIQVRLDSAQLLLARGRSVTDACLAVGFSSPGSFSYLFGRRVGVTPSAYRRQPRPEAVAPGCISLMAMPPGP
jgi:AraC-like DNA-binding protein